MYKAFILLFFLVLLSCSTAQTIGQVTRNETQPATGSEAERLLREGIEFTEAGQLAQAVRAFQEAIKLKPDYADAYAALGRAYFKMREWRTAVDYLHRAAALNAKLRETKNVAQQQSAALNPATTASNKVATAPVARPQQIEPTASTRRPENRAGTAATSLNQTTSSQTTKFEPGDSKTQPVEPPVSKPAASAPIGPTAERSFTPKPAPTQPTTSVASSQPQRVPDTVALKVPETNTTETATSRSLPPQTTTWGASSQPQKVPDVNTTETSTSNSTATNTIEVTQRSAEVTQDERVVGENSSVKSDAASAPEEKEEPTGASVSMSASSTSPTASPSSLTGSPSSPTASPTSTTIETGTVSPIPLNPSTEDISLTKVYRVGPGDVLDVRINEAQPQQSTLFTVTPAGLLEHPLLAEPLNVSALTPEEIQTKIQDDLKKRALIEEPIVTVGVRDYASHSILVSGLVKDSGTKFLRREAIPLYVVVADAQPLPEAAKVTVVRNERNQMFEIDLTNVAQMNLLVRPGDVINLQPNETQFIYVGGEVKDPGEKIFRRGLTLTQAIISAGGVTSKSKVAEIGRDDGEGFLVKTTFKLKDIQTGKTMDPLIKAGDRITILR